jgi:hypothetical protein
MTNPTTPHGVLRRARALLAKPNAWIKGSFQAHRGTQYCAIGAIYKATGYAITKHTGTDQQRYLARLCVDDIMQDVLDAQEGGGPLSQWNDQPYRSHRQVLKLFDKAIAAAHAARA